MLLKKNINETYIRAILISFIVNYNIIRITFDFIPAINNFIYLLFISYFFCSLNKRIKLKMNVISICALGIILYVIVSSIINGNFINHFDILLKFLLGILISLLIVNENKKEFIPIFLNTTVNINTLYSILIILNSIKPYGLGTIASVNYLEWTLSIGFSVSILQNLLLFSNNNKIKNLIKLIIQYICLFLFRARGSILFPIILLILTIIYIMLYRKKLSKKNILIICFIIVIFFVSLNNIENTKVFTRLVSLFYDYNDESRVDIWMNCVNYVKETNGFFIGLGFKGFSNYLIYPHNLYLELIGELGIIGFICLFSLTFKYISILFKLLVNLKEKRINDFYYFGCISGFLYFYLTFLKSFSIYEGYFLFIMMGIILLVKKEVFFNEKDDFSCK